VEFVINLEEDVYSILCKGEFFNSEHHYGF